MSRWKIDTTKPNNNSDYNFLFLVCASMNTKDSQRLLEIEKAVVLSVKDREEMKEDLKEMKE